MTTSICKHQPLLCPFCGGPATLEEDVNDSVGISSWAVGCDELGGTIQCIGVFNVATTFARKIEAANAWNTRDGKLVTLLEQPMTSMPLISGAELREAMEI